MGLKYKYLSSWKYVLRVLATFYEVAGKSAVCRDFMTKVGISFSLTHLPYQSFPLPF